jgi:hypothetical protein
MSNETAAEPRTPWLAGVDTDAPEFTGWDAFGAWRSWLYRHMDDALPATADAFVDGLNTLHEAYLYDLMCRLAVGDPTLATPAAPAGEARR